ncbi:Multi antimicrobial extrusion protein [Cynara cardunculus var. scolymus]|uniref:Multi antimicrobial extrusion protein n=1 Tax=Cynara cardunculus var. scolymus TaxID=59895 RepID=A0A118JZP8_CYNCS|nr:Multi antimicrobial extrusion protein [Cynara cardunculus var. scolymus]
MGIKSDSPMLYPAQQYLKLRSLGAPAVLLSLAMQGVFRGFKDTKTPLYATGFLLLMRVMAVTFCVTLAASMAARQGSTTMAAFQVCLQVWLATSLLADGLAVAGQAILASAFAKMDYEKLGLLLGVALAILLGVGLQLGARLFTKDTGVLHLISIGIPFVAATQPINALAFVFDGVNFGASDFAYAAYSMVLVAIISVLALFVACSHGFVGLWVALTLYMSMRAFAGFWRIGTRTGPWCFLKGTM